MAQRTYYIKYVILRNCLSCAINWVCYCVSMLQLIHFSKQKYRRHISHLTHLTTVRTGEVLTLVIIKWLHHWRTIIHQCNDDTLESGCCVFLFWDLFFHTTVVIMKSSRKRQKSHHVCKYEFFFCSYQDFVPTKIEKKRLTGLPAHGLTRWFADCGFPLGQS